MYSFKLTFTGINLKSVISVIAKFKITKSIFAILSTSQFETYLLIKSLFILKFLKVRFAKSFVYFLSELLEYNLK